MTAIEAADRQRFAEVLRQVSPGMASEVVPLALTEDPEVLARKLVETQRSDDLVTTIVLSF